VGTASSKFQNSQEHLHKTPSTCVCERCETLTRGREKYYHNINKYVQAKWICSDHNIQIDYGAHSAS